MINLIIIAITKEQMVVMIKVVSVEQLHSGECEYVGGAHGPPRAQSRSTPLFSERALDDLFEAPISGLVPKWVSNHIEANKVWKVGYPGRSCLNLIPV